MIDESMPDAADVERLMTVCRPLIQRLRVKHVNAMVATRPDDRAGREELYQLLRSLDVFVAEMGKYVANASYAAVAADQAKETEE